jgi:hypothetical protein
MYVQGITTNDKHAHILVARKEPNSEKHNMDFDETRVAQTT